jgi:hypothetical protein
MKLEDVMVIRECNKDLIVSKSHTPIQYVKIIFYAAHMQTNDKLFIQQH